MMNSLRPCPIQAPPGFGPDFTILALGGEVVVDYSLRVHVILWPAQVFSQTT